jgi:hypothetical protein
LPENTIPARVNENKDKEILFPYKIDLMSKSNSGRIKSFSPLPY